MRFQTRLSTPDIHPRHTIPLPLPPRRNNMSLKRHPPTQTILPIPTEQARSIQDLEIQDFFLCGCEGLIGAPFGFEAFCAVARDDGYFAFFGDIGCGCRASEERLGGFDGDAKVLGERREGIECAGGAEVLD